MSRRIRWVGHPPVFDDPTIQRLIDQGKLPLSEVEKLRAYDERRLVAVPHHAETIVPATDGFSRTYKFGPEPETFVQEMTDADWRLLQTNPWVAIQFLDVTDGDHPRAPLAVREWLALLQLATRQPPLAMAVGVG